MITKPYPDDLIAAQHYTGFVAQYGDRITATKPGMQWDQVLTEYCRGIRSEPAWGIAGSDFHGEGKGAALDTYQTVFLVEKKNIKAALIALARGRIYAVLKPKGPRMSLDSFEIQDNGTGKTAIMGEELSLQGPPAVAGKISTGEGEGEEITVEIIRGGVSLWSFKGTTPLDFNFVDEQNWSGKTFYRLDARSAAGGHLLSNPIFVVKN